MMDVLAGLVVLIWLGLVFFWHGFWRADQRLELSPAPTQAWPRVCAVVPARNEEETIGQCLEGILAQRYAGPLTVIVVNDDSMDDTLQIAEKAGGDRVQVIDGMPLPEGWAGKLWALDQGVQAGAGDEPVYFWFTDADILHGSSLLASLVARAERQRLALASLMVRLPVNGFWEKLLVPAFIFFFGLLYPPRAVNSPASPIAGAAGGCILIRRDALTGIGGLAAIAGAIIDDCALAGAVKASGRRIWLGLGERSWSLRGYDTFGDFAAMVQRSAYTQLRHSPVLLAGAVSGQIITFALPYYLMVFGQGPVFGAGALAVALMSLCYWPTVRYHGLAAWRVFTLAPVALLFAAMTVSSAIAHYTGRNKRWRGRQI